MVSMLFTTVSSAKGAPGLAQNGGRHDNGKYFANDPSRLAGDDAQIAVGPNRRDESWGLFCYLPAL